MKACIYLGAFNIYTAASKIRRSNGWTCKWLDLSFGCQHELPEIEIQQIHVFAARVRTSPNDPSQPTRQLIYFRALETLPNLAIHLCRYVENAVTMRMEKPLPDAPAFVRVIKCLSQ